MTAGSAARETAPAATRAAATADGSASAGDGAGASEHGQNERERAVAADPGIAHDRELVLARAAAAEAVGDVRKAVLVQGAAQPDGRGRARPRRRAMAAGRATPQAHRRWRRRDRSARRPRETWARSRRGRPRARAAPRAPAAGSGTRAPPCSRAAGRRACGLPRQRAMIEIAPLRSFDDLKARLRQLPGPDAAAEGAAAQPAGPADQAGGLARPARGAGGLARRLAGPRAAASRARARPGVRGQPRGRGARRLRLSGRRHGADGRELRGRRRGDQSAVPGRPGGACRRAARSRAPDRRLLHRARDDRGRVPGCDQLAAWQSVPPDLDLLAVGEMGIGNTTAAAAICAALYGGPAAWWTGPGTGLDPHGVAHKAAVVGRGLTRHAEAFRDPLEVLRRLGGREIAAMAGAILAARMQRIPVLLDGFVAGAAAAVLHAQAPDALDHAQAAHLSAEPGHARLLERLQLRAAAPARHAPRRGLRRRARDPALPRRARLPYRHGDLRRGRRQHRGRNLSGVPMARR